MEQQIIKIIAQATRLEEQYLQTNMTTERLWDSLKRVEMVLALEDEFDLMLEPEEIESMQTVEQIVSLITKKVG